MTAASALHRVDLCAVDEVPPGTMKLCEVEDVRLRRLVECARNEQCDQNRNDHDERVAHEIAWSRRGSGSLRDSGRGRFRSGRRRHSCDAVGCLE